jgi:hypothetical protein
MLTNWKSGAEVVEPSSGEVMAGIDFGCARGIIYARGGPNLKEVSDSHRVCFGLLGATMDIIKHVFVIVWIL